MKKIKIFDNIQVDCLKKTEVIDWAENVLVSGIRRQYILCINPEKINLFKKDILSVKLLEKAALRIADGIGIVWAIKKIKNIKTERITGVDLFNELLVLSNRLGKKIYIYGGKDVVLSKAIKIIQSKYPKIDIVGYSDGYISNNESDNLKSEINSLKPNILFLGLGSPKQEKWVDDNLESLDVGIIQTIGGSLDTLVNPSLRAPAFIQKMGLEWFYRLFMQPYRFKRQLKLVDFFMSVIFYRNK